VNYYKFNFIAQILNKCYTTKWSKGNPWLFCCVFLQTKQP
jgi:hypothetical protein